MEYTNTLPHAEHEQRPLTLSHTHTHTQYFYSHIYSTYLRMNLLLLLVVFLRVFRVCPLVCVHLRVRPCMAVYSRYVFKCCYRQLFKDQDFKRSSSFFSFFVSCRIRHTVAWHTEESWNKRKYVKTFSSTLACRFVIVTFVGVQRIWPQDRLGIQQQQQLEWSTMQKHHGVE